MSLVAIGSSVVLLEVSAVLLGLLGLLTFLSRRLRGGGGFRGRKIIPLTGQHSLHVVELDGVRMVVGTGPGGPPRFISELPSGTDGPAADRDVQATTTGECRRGSAFDGR
jgi:hypothetical protein